VANLLEKLRTKDGEEMDSQIEHKSNTNQTEMDDQFAQDPEPSFEINSEPISEKPRIGRPKGSPNRTTGRPPGRPTNLEKQVAEEITMYAELIATVWAVRDPVCGAAAEAQAPKIAAAAARILRRYPQVMARMHSSGQIGDWIALGMACAPVAQAVWSHHIVSHEEEVTDDDNATGGSYADRYPAFTGIARASAVG
jgi:hypothetical protein